MQSQQTAFATLLDSSHLLAHERVVIAGLIGSKRGTQILPETIGTAVYEAAVSLEWRQAKTGDGPWICYHRLAVSDASLACMQLAAAPNGAAKLLFQAWYQQDMSTLEPSYRLEVRADVD